jgi:hypothetical protein
MNLNSPLFDRIRANRAPRSEPRVGKLRCDFPGCEDPGEFKAPMGRLREGQYFCFCLQHVREYNASYNYFDGMNDEAVARYIKDASIGHRPTWVLGAKRGFAPAGHAYRTEPFAATRARTRPQGPGGAARRLSPVSLKALESLGLDETAGAEAITARYKELVKRHHPDANGGDRSCEEKLREIIHAYKTLRAARVL